MKLLFSNWSCFVLCLVLLIGCLGEIDAADSDAYNAESGAVRLDEASANNSAWKGLFGIQRSLRAKLALQSKLSDPTTRINANKVDGLTRHSGNFLGASHWLRWHPVAALEAGAHTWVTVLNTRLLDPRAIDAETAWRRSDVWNADLAIAAFEGAASGGNRYREVLVAFAGEMLRYLSESGGNQKSQVGNKGLAASDWSGLYSALRSASLAAVTSQADIILGPMRKEWKVHRPRSASVDLPEAEVLELATHFVANPAKVKAWKSSYIEHGERSNHRVCV